jgi:hypothetical protein
VIGVLAFFWLLAAMVGVLFKAALYGFLYATYAFFWFFKWTLKVTVWLAVALAALVRGRRNGEAT